MKDAYFIWCSHMFQAIPGNQTHMHEISTTINTSPPSPCASCSRSLHLCRFHWDCTSVWWYFVQLVFESCLLLFRSIQQTNFAQPDSWVLRSFIRMFDWLVGCLLTSCAVNRSWCDFIHFSLPSMAAQLFHPLCAQYFTFNFFPLFEYFSLLMLSFFTQN